MEQMSYRAHSHDATPSQTERRLRVNATVAQELNSTAYRNERLAGSRDRSSVASSTSGGRHSTDSSDGALVKASSQRRVSALPRPSTGQPASRGAAALSRPPSSQPSERRTQAANVNQLHQSHIARTRELPHSRTQKTTFGSSLSTSAGSHSVRTKSNMPKSSLDSDPESILGIAMPGGHRPSRPAIVLPSANARRQREELPPGLIPELQALAASNARSASAQASIGSISSPSTLFTESPGTWSSRNTTPTSMSSYSPGLVQPLKTTVLGKRATTVPIPAGSKTKLPTLPVLTEALHSSSSSMTTAGHASTPNKPKRKKIADSPAPTPPPRLSSVKRKPVEGDEAPSAEHLVSTPGHSRLPVTRPDESPLTQKSSQRIEAVGESLEASTRARELQQAFGFSSAPAPSRPSREGVAQLDLRRPIAVDNIVPPHQREQSRDQKLAVSEKATQGSSRIPTSSRENVTARPRPRHTGTDDPTVRSPYPQHSGSHPKLEAPKKGARRGNVSKPVATEKASPASRLGKFSKFSFFSRPNKAPDNTHESPRKLQRKGPAAGTGHEGYGRFSRRGRKSSMDSSEAGSSTDRSESSLERIRSPFRRRKPSTSSRRDRSSQSDLDDFVAQRLRPVVMVGGSARPENDGRADWPDLNQPVFDNRLVSTSAPEVNDPHTGHYDYARPHSTSLSSGRSGGGPPETEYLPIAYHDPGQTNRALHGTDIFAPGYVTSANTSQSSIPSSVTAFAGNRGLQYKQNTKIAQQQEKKAKKSKWNFFHRSNPRSKTAQAPTLPLPPAPRMAVRISSVPQHKSVPFYAIIDSESENNTKDSLGEMISQAVDSPPPLPRQDPARITSHHVPRPQSTLLPSLPVSASRIVPPSPSIPPEAPPQTQTPLIEPEQPKRRRLAAVGRIPRVVSRKGRPEAGEPSAAHVTPATAQSQTERPSLRLMTRASLSKATRNAPMSKKGAERQEFLRFPSKHSSDVSASSSSTGMLGIAAPAGISSAASHIAPVRHHGGEDEVWNEFDDFLDHVMSPASQRKQELARPVSRGELRAPVKMVQPSQALPNAPALPKSKAVLAITAPPALFPPKPLLSEADSSEEIRLRRSRIHSALHSSMDPTSPFSVGDYLSEYGDWNRYSGKLSERLSVSTPDKSGYLSPVSQLPPQDPAPHTEHTQQQNAALLDAVARTQNPAAQSELHFASLMISRWLSFGRVLFSPAHEEVSNQPERHVLVLDGLASADWSIFCSVTYSSTNTFVHDLKERDGQSPIEAEYAPPNYRRAEVSSFGDRFPFPPSFFSAIVLRFPPAMPDKQLKNIITECKRVLAPGGFLELMLLDLDIVNMGVQTRRAIRELKIRVATADRAISLKPLSDNIQGHLGQQGFPSLSRCVVGVPVAGKASGSMDSSSSSRSSGGSSAQHSRLSADAHKQPGRQHLRQSHRPHGQNFSLSDLVADHSENADAKIGKMVSRTARSWWQHCFEASVIPDGNLSRSIFASKTLMRECKMRGSNFKLLIAYTQKPLENKRRTMSEPIVPTLATAGLRRGKKTTA